MRRTSIVLATVIVLLFGAANGYALLDFSEYSTVEALEADLDRTFQELESAVDSAQGGPIDYIELTHIRNLVQARHHDYSFFIFMGRPTSKDEVVFYRKVDQVVSKYDNQLLELFRGHYDQFDERDRDEVDTMMRTLTAEYAGLLEPVPSPDPNKLEAEAYKEQHKAYLWFQIQEALYNREYKEALRLLESKDAIQYAEDPAQRLMLIGAVYYYYENYKKAVEHLEQALPLLPRESNGFLDLSTKRKDLAQSLARIHSERLGDIEKAEKHYEIVLEDESGNAEFLNTYAWFLLEKKNNTAKARPLIEKALAKEPEDPYIQDTYGYLLMKEGNQEGAAEYFRRALGSKDLSLEAKEVIKAHLHMVEGEQ